MITDDARVVDTNRPVAVDASWLPNHAFGHHSLMWWGTVGVMAIEGMAFALAIVTYVYVWTRLDAWPPDVLPPDLRFGTLNLAILLASLLMSLLYLGGESAQLNLALPSSVTGLFQGTLLFFLLAADVLILYRVRWTRRRAAPRVAA